MPEVYGKHAGAASRLECCFELPSRRVMPIMIHFHGEPDCLLPLKA